LSEGEGKDEALSIEALDIFQKEGKKKSRWGYGMK
jgi:hypothetical protein